MALIDAANVAHFTGQRTVAGRAGSRQGAERLPVDCPGVVVRVSGKDSKRRRTIEADETMSNGAVHRFSRSFGGGAVEFPLH